MDIYGTVGSGAGIWVVYGLELGFMRVLNSSVGYGSRTRRSLQLRLRVLELSSCKSFLPDIRYIGILKHQWTALVPFNLSGSNVNLNPKSLNPRP